jgi:predicted nuclease of predicted toxin-antitoxin system
MKILFDQGVPAPLRKLLLSHQISTAYEEGWDTLKNGQLLTSAEANDFNVLFSTDQHMKFQQNLQGRKIAVVVLLSTSWPKIQLSISAIIAALEKINEGVCGNSDLKAKRIAFLQLKDA